LQEEIGFDSMTSGLKIRTKQEDDFTLVRILIEHPMETGRRRDEVTGAIVPAHFITEVEVTHNGKPIVRGEMTTGVSKTPYLQVRFRGGRPGDRIGVRWVDNLGQSDSGETRIS
jgi:sulfur-oxidizing protein SoxZ